MADYIKLAEAPSLTIYNPQCGACCIETESDSDGFQCPCCGTCWSYSAGEDPGTLYVDWSGEDLDGDTIANDDAHHYGYKIEKAKRDRLLTSLGIKL